MAEVLTEDQIRHQFKDEWVLLGDVVSDESLHMRAGVVLYHSKDRDDVYRRAAEMRASRHPGTAHIGFMFTGELPEDMEFAL